MDIKGFQGSLGTYKQLITDDGSISLYSSAFDEACHTQSGAITETKHVYLEGAKVREHFQNHRSGHIFEVGFGTGVGFSATIEALAPLNPQLVFVSSEIDPELAIYSIKELLKDRTVTSFERRIENGLDLLFAKTKQETQLIILLGDVRETLKLWQKHPLFEPFNRIYQDPFSPKKNPLLWTQEWFKQLFDAAHKEAVLSTYSSTKAAWKALLNTGWQVETFTGFGRKRLCTRASKKGSTKPEIYQLCKSSPKEAFRDLDYRKA
jgi:tRNA U34 5-methylaminomethyl-2-thiouridine-forming methyltransferase MnmC